MLNEAWVHAIGGLNDIVKAAVTAESEGWDGVYLAGNPLSVPDPWVSIALAMRETSRIRMGTGVATPAPQIAAALAGSSTTVQRASGGRVVLGLGRGDLAAAFLGMAPMPVGYFERYVARVQGYLRGEELPFDLELDGGGLFPPVSTLGTPDAPTTSKFTMFMQPDGTTPKVPLEVFASGPKVIGVGARHADRVTFSIGAEPERIQWAVATAREASAAVGRDPADVSLGAVLSVCPHPDRELARELVKGSVASTARFRSMHGTVQNSVADGDKNIYQRAHDEFTYHGHLGGSAQPEVATPEFIDRFAVVGTVEQCADRLRDVLALGIERVTFGLPAFVPSTDAVKVEAVAYARKCVVDELLPALRQR